MKNLILSLVMTFIVLPASIGATTITGIIRNSVDSTAVIGAKVVLIQGVTRVDSTITDGAGSYSLLNVTNGNKSLQTSATGYNTSTTNTTVDTAVATSTVNLYIVFTLPGTLSGVVRTLLDSVPLAGAKVYLRRGSATSAIVDSATSGGNGAYSFGNLTPGTPNYYLAVTATGFIPATSNNIAVGNGATVTRNFYLGVPATLSGSVISAVDNISALAGATVYLRRTSGTTAILDSATTNSTGEYSFANVSPGTPNYWITASLAGYGSITNANVVVPSGGDLISNFFLPLIAPGNLIGSVKNAADSLTAVVGAKVYLRRTSATSAILDSATIDGSGNFGFDNLVAGAPNYFVTASAAGFQSATNSNVVVPNGGDAISNFFLVVTIPASIEGIVSRLPDSLPLAGAKVYLRRTSATSAILDSATTDASGAYAISILAPGTPNYFLTVNAAGFVAGTSNNIAVGNGAAVIRNFLMVVALPSTLGGTVRNAVDSLPMAGVNVYLRRNSATDPILDMATTDAAGAYAFTNLASGAPNYYLEVSTADFVSGASNNITVGNGAVVTRNFYLAVATGLHFPLSGSEKRLQFTRLGNQLFVNMGFSSTSRTLKVYDLQGFARHQVRVLPGESRAMVPAAFAPAKGYLYQTK